MEGLIVIESLLNNPESITFTVLFVGLLVYVMKTNDVREKNYRETITQLTTALSSLKNIEEDISDIKNKVGINNGKIHDSN